MIYFALKESPANKPHRKIKRTFLLFKNCSKQIIESKKNVSAGISPYTPNDVMMKLGIVNKQIIIAKRDIVINSFLVNPNF